MRFGIQPQLFDKANDDGKGGGGGDPQKPFSDEQVAALGQIVNAAVTDKLKSFEKNKLAPAIAEGLKGVKWDETLTPVLEKLLENVPDDDEPNRQQKPGDKKPDPQVAALEAKLTELTTQLQKQSEAARLAQEAARDEKAYGALRSALTQHVRQDALDIAASHLFHARKLVTFDEQGNPLLKVRKAPFAGGSEEDVEMPLADGVQHWIKSSEGKFFAPAPGAGSGAGNDPKGGGAPRRVNLGGDGMPRYDQPATTDAEKIRRAEEREAAIRQRYPNM